MYIKAPQHFCFILLPLLLLLTMKYDNVCASEKVTVHLKDGGTIVGKLQKKNQTSVTIQTSSMLISINTTKINTIQYHSTEIQVNNQPLPGEELEPDVIDHKACGHYNVLCNRQLIVLTIDSALKNFRHPAPKKMCKTISRVCKELKFQFQPITQLENFYKLSMQCFQNYLMDYRNTVKGEGNSTGPQNVAALDSKNNETVIEISREHTLCLGKAEASLYD